MKKILLYFVFWVLAQIISSVVTVFILILPRLDRISHVGGGDPEFFAGILSAYLMKWLFISGVSTIMVYPLYFVFKTKLRFASVYAVASCFTLFFASGFFQKGNLSNIDLQIFLIFMAEVYFFVFVGLVIPTAIQNKRAIKIETNVTVSTFD